MSDLINKAIEALESNETSNIFTEAASTPSLGKLAASHYHHHSLHVYGSEAGESDSQIRSHAAKATKIHGQIEAHHGKQTADAVKDHSETAGQVENSSMGHASKHFHSDFVNKHLGGKGSTEHQAYKKQITHHDDDEVADHQNDSHWNAHA
jgi:hypothetical protein